MIELTGEYCTDVNLLVAEIERLREIERLYNEAVGQEPYAFSYENRNAPDEFRVYKNRIATHPQWVEIELYAAPVPQAPAVQSAPDPDPAHHDDAAVDSFAEAMKSKMAASRAKGRSGWQECYPTDLSRMLREHVSKGDPVDVANFCMMLWNLGHGIATAEDCSGGAVQGSYQAIFNAIAAATKIEGGNIAISVQDFQAALAAAPKREGRLKAAGTEDQAIYDAIAANYNKREGV